MTTTILPAADTLQRDQRAALAADYEHADGFPVLLTLLSAATLVVVAWVSVREARRTKRQFNLGILTAGLLVALTLVWWLVVSGIANGRLGEARGSNASASALSQVRVDLLQMRADETATVADSGPGGIAPQAAGALQGRLATGFSALLGPGGRLDTAENVVGRDPALESIRTAASSWQDALRSQGAGSDASRVQFVRLTAALGDGISTDQGERTAAIQSASTVLGGLAFGPAVLAVLAAAAAVAGFRPRLREYR